MRQMTKAIIPIVFCILALSTTAFAKTPGEVDVGSVLREAPLYGFSGDFRKLSELRGKPLIINVWASWCGPCRAEMGSLERLSRRFGGKQFNIIGVSTDDDAGAAAAFLVQAKVTFDNYLDRNLLLENMLGANTIPLTLLVDARGRVLMKFHGSREWDNAESLDLIGRTLRKKM
jgi:thiol-disulfide isomerase/thioredoxin